MEVLPYVIIVTLLSCASSHLTCASPASFSRRHLSQAPVTDPSTSTPGGLPFFPADGSSSPPPPPPPALPMPPPSPLPPSTPTYATFPANISALVLPRSSKPHTASKTLLIPLISAVLAAAIAIGVALFLYGRRQGQNRNSKHDTKTIVASDTTTTPSGQQAPCPLPRNNTENKLTVYASTSGFVKPDSPEISPLPPLSSHNFHQQQSSEEEEEQEQEEEDDDFYSPLGSLAGKEPRENINYSSSDSPGTSPSVTIARNNNKRNRHVSSLRMFTLWNQSHSFFPRISSASTSPERGGGGGGTILTPDDAYARSSMYSSVSTTPDRFFRKVLDTSPPRWNDFSRNVKSLFLSASPAREDFCIISESSRKRESAAVPPPPPERPPPPAMPAPPPLVPPSQSFMVQKSGRKLSWDATTATKPKMKPLPWDRVRPSSCRKNTWDSLKFNSLNANPKQRSLSCDLPVLNQENRVLDPRKSQSIAFLLSTLDLTANEVVDALRDGHYEALGVEVLESLSRVAPSEEEERKLKSYDDDSVIIPSERFLKELLNVPFVFKRVDALLFVATFDSKLEQLKQSFGVIKAACEELRKSRMLLKLIEVVLETGMKSVNALNFKLEALLDGGTTLLRSVVQNIIESEGIKVLQVVRDLSLVLVDVKRTAEMDYGVLRSDVSELYQGVQRVNEILLLSEENGSKFKETLTKFLETAVKETEKIETEDGSTLSAVREITEMFHGDLTKEEAQLLRVFVIVRDFVSVLEKVCKEMEVNRQESTLAKGSVL